MLIQRVWEIRVPNIPRIIKYIQSIWFISHVLPRFGGMNRKKAKKYWEKIRVGAGIFLL